MIEDGIGGSKTQTGLKFEEKIDLRKAFIQLKDYLIKGDELYYKNKLVAKFFKKYKLYSHFLAGYGVSWEKILSKKLLPDESILVISNKTLFIIEMKFQKVAGSVDEKLQTCDFKLRQYKKLLANQGINVRYIYILNDWFKKDEYKDTKEYIRSVNCEYFFEELPLSALGLPESQ